MACVSDQVVVANSFTSVSAFVKACVFVETHTFVSHCSAIQATTFVSKLLDSFVVTVQLT